MDSCVLIPPEFGLVMVPHPGRLLEMTATLWTRRVLVPGMEFFPDRGEIRLDRLEVFSRIKEDDVRRHYGCTEDIWLVEGSEVRHCNWVRFLRTCNDPAEANIMGSKVDQHTVYRVLTCIPPNRELVAYLEPIESLDTEEECEKEIEEIEAKRIKLEPKEPEDSMMRYSPISPVLPCSPITREDECLSGQSDDACETIRSDRTLSKSDTSEDDSVTAMDLSISRPMVHARSATVSPPVRRNRERTWLPCEVCGKKFDRPSLLKRHMRTHTGEKPHACDVCGKAFSTSSSLNTHRRIHSGEKPHQCNVCGKCFTASSNLYYHRMTHNKEKPHKCNLCSKSFPTPGDLKSHMYVHNGSWPFKCDICNRGFSKQTNLKNHLILHTGEKPYECNLCGKKFALQCNLKTHSKSHEGETQEECGKCGKGFLTSSKQLYNGFCKMCFSGSPQSDQSSEKSSISSPISDFSISSITSSSDIEKERSNSARRSSSSRRISIGNGSPSAPTIAFPVPVHASLQPGQANAYFNGGSPVTAYPLMPTSPPGSVDRQLFLQGIYSQMMSERHLSPPSAMRDGYFPRVNTQIPVMASHY